MTGVLTVHFDPAFLTWLADTGVTVAAAGGSQMSGSTLTIPVTNTDPSTGTTAGPDGTTGIEGHLDGGGLTLTYRGRQLSFPALGFSLSSGGTWVYDSVREERLLMSGGAIRLTPAGDGFVAKGTGLACPSTLITELPSLLGDPTTQLGGSRQCDVNPIMATFDLQLSGDVQPSGSR
jgi:hypothetical protein